jgi:hypothetical protein
MEGVAYSPEAKSAATILQERLREIQVSIT